VESLKPPKNIERKIIYRGKRNRDTLWVYIATNHPKKTRKENFIYEQSREIETTIEGSKMATAIEVEETYPLVVSPAVTHSNLTLNPL
jgi:hypothetical protein